MITIVFRNKTVTFLTFILLVVCMAAGLCGCGKQKMSEQSNGSENGITEYTKTDFVMDTVLSETIYGEKDLTDEVKNQLSVLEKEKLSWREENSETAQINASGSQGEPYVMDEDFSMWVNTSLELSEASEGAFDPTIGNLTRLWNIEGENPTVPAQDEIDRIMKEIGYSNIKINEETHSISMEDGCTLDLGAVGKGIGCDVIKEYLQEEPGVKGAVISVGGSILVYGDKGNGEDWTVAIRDPEKELDSYMGVLHLSETACVSTSGDYEKYFMQDGKKYHHILDPTTGYPAESDLTSVTVVCRQGEKTDGLLSDGLSTACFVLGKEKGMQLLEQYGAGGIFIDKENRVYVTGDLEDQFEILNEEYSLIK